MANLKQGMSGSEVKDLQKKLISEGYGDLLGKGQDDGIFGAKTAAAVKQYQKDNGLAVDGIAGKNTLGALYSTGSSSSGSGSNKPADTESKAPSAPSETPKAEPPAPTTSPGGVTTGDFYYAPFDPMADETIKQAQDILNQHNASRPGAWTDPYADQYMGYLNQFENRDPFSYDFNSDALYQQYKDQYILQGQMAMMDTMGQAAAMTGGYGNSYAQTVGQQAYNQYLGQLNEVMPELYGMAYDQYNQEGQELLDMYGLYKGLSDDSFSKYQTEMDNWYQESSRLTDNYNTLYNRGWNEHLDGKETAWNEYITDRSENFTEGQNAKSDLIDLITSVGYNPTDEELAAAGMTREQANGYKDYYDNSTKTTGGNGGNGGTGNEPVKYADFGYDEQQKWGKKFEGATSIPDIENIGDDMEAAGIDPKTVGKWVDRYSNAFKKKAGEGFTGTTYAEATEYMRTMGVSGDYISSVMTDGEWARHKSGYSTYADYLKAYVKKALGN